MSTGAPWQVDVFSVGRSRIRGPQGFWNDKWDEWVPLALNAALVRRPGRTILVNTSPPEDTAGVERDFPHMRYLHDAPRGDLERRPEEYVEQALGERGVAISEVHDVVLTPFELYTTGTLMLFREANIHLSRRGWLHLHTFREHPHDKRWRKFPRETLTYLVTDGWERICLLDDEDEIAPGVRTWWAGSHHRESILVEVDTPSGTVGITDAFFYFENVARGLPMGLCESLEEAGVARTRILRDIDHLVPIHEPGVFDRYPGGVIR